MDRTLLQELNRRLTAGGRTIAVVGIGQELRGDDGAGGLVVRHLQRLVRPLNQQFVIDAGPCPENYTGVLRRLRPDIVIFVDAADFDAEPGSIRVLDWRMSSGVNASTHALSLRPLCSYLTQTIGCQVLLIIVQAGDTGFGKAMSGAVQSASRQVAWALAELLQPPASARQHSEDR